MKRIILIGLLISMTACTSKTDFGDCIGAFDEKRPDKVYKVSGWNAFMGVVGTSLLFVPTILVLKDQTFCPVGNK